MRSSVLSTTKWTFPGRKSAHSGCTAAARDGSQDAWQLPSWAATIKHERVHNNFQGVRAFHDGWSGWAEVAPMSVPRSSCGAACLHGRLYVVGGNAGDDTFHASTEAFRRPAAGSASLSHGRSSLALAAV